MNGGNNGINNIENKTDRAEIIRKLRDDPARVLFGSKAKRAIMKWFIVDPDGKISLKEIKMRKKISERDAISAFRELYAAEILKKKKEGRVVYYQINKDSVFGKLYLNILRNFSGIIIASTEVEEDIDLSNYIR